MNAPSDVPLGHLLDTLIDYRGKTPPKAESGVELVTAKVIKNGRITTSRPEYISEETYEGWMRRGLPRRGDILITTEAPLGEVAQLRTDERIALAQRVILLRLDASLVHPQFVFHFLRSPEALARLTQRSSGTTVSGIRQPELRAVLIPLLEQNQQFACAGVLDAFDELIEVNERRIDMLENLARSLYREWFVHFRFPGHEHVQLVDSELGPIPEGWGVRELGDLATLYRQARKPGDESDSTFEHFSIPAFDSGVLPASDLGSAIKSRKYRVDVESVLLSKINPRFPRVWFAQPRTVDAIASTEFLVWVGVDVSNAWLWSLFMDETFRRTLVGSAGGTSNSHQRFKLADVAGRRVALPPPAVLELFDSLADPALRQATIIREQNRQVAATRDLLLPRLVTGRLDISDIHLGVLTPAEVE